MKTVLQKIFEEIEQEGLDLQDIGATLWHRKEELLEAEKRQIIDGHRAGFLDGRLSFTAKDFMTGKEYYNQTYGGEQ